MTNVAPIRIPYVVSWLVSRFVDDPEAWPGAGCGVTHTGRCVPAASGEVVIVPSQTSEEAMEVGVVGGVVSPPRASTPCAGTTTDAVASTVANSQRLAVAHVLCFISRRFDRGNCRVRTARWLGIDLLGEWAERPTD